MFGGIKKRLCDKCQKEISVNNFNKHTSSCNGVKIKKIRGIDFDPNWAYKNGIRKGWNKGLTKETSDIVKKYSESLKTTYKEKPLHGCCSFDRKTKSEYAVKQGFGGYRENAGRSKKYKVVDSFGKQITLQSSYELKCKEILEELNIRWIRPKALKYNNKKYFADFYLVDFDLYLDPKNDYKAKQDEEKIRLVIEQNNVKVLILLKEHINKEYISGII